jgi:hypothetical protein
MLAPPVAKPKSVPPQPLAATPHQPDEAAIAHRELFRETIGNQATLRHLAKRASVTRKAPRAYENQDELTGMPSREAAPSWDFSKSPTLSQHLSRTRDQ